MSKKKSVVKKKTTKTAKKPVKKTPAKKSVAKKKTVKKKAGEDEKIAQSVILGIQEKKGKNIVLLDLTEMQNAVCKYFIVCEGDSGIQVNAIADSIEDTVKKEAGVRPYHQEGRQNSQWILIDYVTVVVHVFLPEVRQFYNLEALWADANVKQIKD